MVIGARNSEFRHRSSETGAQSSETGARSSEFAKQSSEFGKRSSELVWKPELGARSSQSGARSSQSGARSWEIGTRTSESGARSSVGFRKNQNGCHLKAVCETIQMTSFLQMINVYHGRKVGSTLEAMNVVQNKDISELEVSSRDIPRTPDSVNTEGLM